jgi:hypothetical protein
MLIFSLKFYLAEFCVVSSTEVLKCATLKNALKIHGMTFENFNFERINLFHKTLRTKI